VRQLPHPEVIDDEQRHGRQVSEEILARAIERRVGKFLQQDVRLTIEDAVPLQDGRAAQGLREVTFPGAWRVSYMMPIILRRSRCITGGIRYTARRCRSGGAHRIGMGNTSSAVSPMTRSVRCRRGCSIPLRQTRPSALP
jgi:hypothetical protein